MDITKKRLEDLYKNNPNKVVCEKLGISNPTLISYLKKYGIETKGKGWHFKRENTDRFKLHIID